MTRKQLILKEMQQKMDWLKENTNYNIAFLFLRGSQNYGMDEYTESYKSNFDIMCFVIPSLKDLLENTQKVSKTYEMNDKSHIDVKDIRCFPELLYKQNLGLLEILFTPYFLINKDYYRVRSALLHKNLKDMRDDIANMDVTRFLKGLSGMAHQKYSHLENVTPATEELIRVYGYNPKELHHLIRCSEILHEVIRLDGKVKFDELMTLNFLTKKRKLEIKHYKTEPIPYTEALKVSKMCMNKIDKEIEEFLSHHKFSQNKETIDKMNTLFDEYVSLCVKNDVLEDIRRMNIAKKEKEGANTTLAKKNI